MIYRLKVPGLEVIKLEYSLKLNIKRNDWLLEDTCKQDMTSLSFLAGRTVACCAISNTLSHLCILIMYIKNKH